MNKQIENSCIDKLANLQNCVSIKQELRLAQQISMTYVMGDEQLLELLVQRRIVEKTEFSSLDSILFEVLSASNSEKIQRSLYNYFSNGIVQLQSSLNFDYQPLQNLLIVHDYKEADKLTQIHLCKLAGLDRISVRNWLYFTDIALIPSEDLLMIDLLWRMYSRNKFGFSQQRKIWLNNSSNWDKFWLQIGWTEKGLARRYPDEFMWNIDAPCGHLPLFNQLRGVQVMSALFDHIVWHK